MSYAKQTLWLSALMALSCAGNAANLAPSFEQIPAKTVAEGKTLSFSVSASDPEGETVTIFAKRLKTWMSFSNNVFTASPGTSHSGVHNVTFTAKDSYGKTTNLTVPITVTNANQPPEFDALRSRTVAEGGTLTFTVNARDRDKDVVTYSAAPLKSWMKFTGSTFTATPGHNDSGTYLVTITASDGAASTQAVQTITVNDVDQAPVFGSLGSFNVAEGGSLTETVTASDPDGGAVTITATGLLNGWMSFDGKKFTATPDYTKVGSYPITFIASDGAKQTKYSVTLTVSDTNRAPVLNPIGAWKVGEGHSLSVPITASDEDGDNLTLTASGLKSWMSFDGRTFRAQPRSGQRGDYTVTFKASDGTSSASQTSAITVSLDDSAFPHPWTEYWGSQWTGAPWSGTERSWLGYLTGSNLIDSPNKVNSLVDEVSARIQQRDVIITIAGFGGDSGDTSDGTLTSMGDLFDLLQSGGLGTWQSAVMAQVEALSPLDPTGTHLIYQLGNEITKPAFSDTLRNWAARRGIELPGTNGGYDQELIPYYVEYYLAPTVEAAQLASLNYYGDKEALTLALGSIGSGGTTAARDFLDILLDYEVGGTYAPSLAGKRVYELVDLITVHYPGSAYNLDMIWDKWQGVGSLRGLWTTETVGINAAEAGEGAGKTVGELASHLGWQYRRGYGPDVARVSIYGWDVGNGKAGTPAAETMTTFFDFLGNSPLEVESDYAVVTGASSDLAVTQFNSVDDGSRRVITVTTITQQSQSSAVQSVTFNKDGWSGHVTATLHQFNANGHKVSDPLVSEDATSYTVTLNPAVNLTGVGDALMFTLVND